MKALKLHRYINARIQAIRNAPRTVPRATAWCFRVRALAMPLATSSFGIRSHVLAPPCDLGVRMSQNGPLAPFSGWSRRVVVQVKWASDAVQMIHSTFPI